MLVLNKKITGYPSSPLIKNDFSKELPKMGISKELPKTGGLKPIRVVEPIEKTAVEKVEVPFIRPTLSTPPLVAENPTLGGLKTAKSDISKPLLSTQKQQAEVKKAIENEVQSKSGLFGWKAKVLKYAVPVIAVLVVLLLASKLFKNNKQNKLG